MVFAGIFPVETEDFEELRDCMDKLQLNDASLTYELETSQAPRLRFPLQIPWNAAPWRSSRKGWSASSTRR